MSCENEQGFLQPRMHLAYLQSLMLIRDVLWYITFEIRIYLVWILIKSLGLFESKSKTNVTLLILWAWVISRPEIMPIWGSENSLYGMVDFPQYTITLVIGALTYINVECLKLKWKHVLLMIVAMIVFRHSNIATWIWAVGYVVIAMVMGTSASVLKLKIKDLSYGIFLYGWTTGQIVYEIMPNASALVAAIATAIIATLLAFISGKIIDLLGLLICH